MYIKISSDLGYYISLFFLKHYSYFLGFQHYQDSGVNVQNPKVLKKSVSEVKLQQRKPSQQPASSESIHPPTQWGIKLRFMYLSLFGKTNSDLILNFFFFNQPVDPLGFT